MKKEFLAFPDATITIPGALWVRINKIAKYLHTTPEAWVEQRLRGQLSRFTHKIK